MHQWMFVVWRRALVGAVLFGCALLAACSKDDAEAAKVASAALKSRVEVALSAHADLLAHALVEEQESEAAIFRSEVQQAMGSANRATWTVNEDAIRRKFTRPDPRARVRDSFKAQAQEVLDAMADLEAAAADFEKAWPFGAQQFVCVKKGVFGLTHNLRKVAVSFDRDAKQRYQPWKVPARIALHEYQEAVRSGNAVAAAAGLQAFRDLLRAEEKQNADVQAAYVQAAQASADFYAAIEAVENVSLADVLKVVQRYAPLLSRLEDTIDGDAIARRAGVTLGKLENSDWLQRFAKAGVPAAAVTCKRPA